MIYKKEHFNSSPLKQFTKNYEVSYPTVHIRVDNLIQKIEMIKKKRMTVCE